MTAVTARSTRWHGLEALELDNGRLRVTVVPSMGAHVAELEDLEAGRDLLWHNPRATPRPAPYGANFDDAMLTTFIDAVRSGRQPQPDVHVGLRTLSIVLAAQESARTGRTVPVVAERAPSPS